MAALLTTRDGGPSLARPVFLALLASGLLIACPGTGRADRDPVAGTEAVFDVGVRTAEFEHQAAPQDGGRQRMENWCWAACIQMVLNYHGVPITQEQIVERTFGAQVDEPALPQHILANLNEWAADGDGARVQVAADLVRFSGSEIVYDLTVGQPLIIGLTLGGAMSHAYVLTALRYVDNPYGGEPWFLSVVLRDPWPGNPSRIEVPWTAIAGHVTFLARVHVTPVPGDEPPSVVLGAWIEAAPGGGLRVREVVADSAAAEIGLAAGDVIYGADRFLVLAAPHLEAVLQQKAADDVIVIRFLREGATHQGTGRLRAR